MLRPAALLLILLAAALLIAGCGGGSALSEKEVAEHLRGHAVYAVECAQTAGGGGDAYDCTALTSRSNVPVKLAVTVSQSGKAVFVTHCEVTKKSVPGEPCAGIH